MLKRRSPVFERKSSRREFISQIRNLRPRAATFAFDTSHKGSRRSDFLSLEDRRSLGSASTLNWILMRSMPLAVYLSILITAPVFADTAAVLPFANRTSAAD